MVKRQLGRGGSLVKVPVRRRQTLEHPPSVLVCKQISNKDVGFDNPTAILEVEGRQVPFLVVRRAQYNQRWEDLEKLTMPLARLIEHYTIDLRSQNKSDKTVSWYIPGPSSRQVPSCHPRGSNNPDQATRNKQRQVTPSVEKRLKRPSLPSSNLLLLIVFPLILKRTQLSLHSKKSGVDRYD